MARPTRRSVLLVLEGDTEHNYVNAVRRYAATRHIQRPINAKGGGGIVNALVRTNLDAFTEIWIMMDAERHPHRSCMEVGRWIRNQHEPQRFKVALSAPKVEAWLLAHYERPSEMNEVECRLVELTGYNKPHLPKGFPREAWQSAATVLHPMGTSLPDRLPNRPPCPLCLIGSSVPSLLPLLLGEDE